MYKLCYFKVNPFVLYDPINNYKTFNIPFNEHCNNNTILFILIVGMVLICHDQLQQVGIKRYGFCNFK